MGRTKRVKAVTPGSRTGTKRSDFRWTAPDGQVWASRFEFEVYTQLKEQGYAVRKTTKEDSLPYTSTVVGGKCLQCGSGKVAQEHTFTADLFVGSIQGDGGNNGGDRGSGDRRDAGKDVPAGYYIECKGYLRASRRSLLRSFRKAQPDIDLRLVIQRDYPVGKGSLTDWATKYLKVPVCVWKGSLEFGKGWLT